MPLSPSLREGSTEPSDFLSRQDEDHMFTKVSAGGWRTRGFGFFSERETSDRQLLGRRTFAVKVAPSGEGRRQRKGQPITQHRDGTTRLIQWEKRTGAASREPGSVAQSRSGAFHQGGLMRRSRAKTWRSTARRSTFKETFKWNRLLLRL